MAHPSHGHGAGFWAWLAVGLAGAVAAAYQPSPTLTFTDVTRAAGIGFVHQNGAAGDKWYPELFGGGVAVLDIDGDGWPDLLFVNGRPWTAASQVGLHRLYRNNRDGTFRDVTAGSGFDTANVYGLGASVADYDNDGRDDVFMTTVDGGRLFHNEGGGRFRDVTARAGMANREFAVSAAWLDYDRDGQADLFVGNYVRWSPASEVQCAQDGERGYCGPDAYKPTAPTLYRNLGGGRFDDVTARAGMSDPADKAMGVAVLDFNGDGWPDLFIGSDRVPAKLFRNTGRGGFVDDGLAAGVALSEQGVARANMGVDAADYDRSGRPHILVGNFVNEMLGLYRNTDGRFFTDVAPRTDVGRASLLAVTWAVFFFDCRPRRLPRHLRAQRRHRRITGAGSAGAAEPCRRCCSATAARAPSRTSRRASAPRSPGRSWGGARPMPTSTATATSTWPSRR